MDFISDFKNFKQEINELLNIDLNVYKESQLKRRLENYLRRRKMESSGAYLELLKSNIGEQRKFIDFLFINVTEFFRTEDKWYFFEEKIIPSLIERFGKKLKIWSAGCSTGEEPYSLAMSLLDYTEPENLQIIATDIDDGALFGAKKGLYGERTISTVPDKYRKRYFSKIGDEYLLSGEIKGCVEFKHHNIVCDEYFTDCNLIVCRNMLIYLTEVAKNNVFSHFAQSLKSGGYLFLGSAEQIIHYKEMGYSKVSRNFYEKI